MAIRYEALIQVDDTQATAPLKRVEEQAVKTDNEMKKLEKTTRDYSKIPIISYNAENDIKKVTKAVQDQTDAVKLSAKEQESLRRVQQNVLESQKRNREEWERSDKQLKNHSMTTKEFKSTIEDMGKKLLLYIGTIIAVGKAWEFVKSAVASAIEEELLQRQMQQNIVMLGNATEGMAERTREWITAMSIAHGVVKSDLIPSLNLLMAATSDVGQAQVGLQMATIAYEHGIGTAVSANATVIARYIQSGNVMVRQGNAFAAMLKVEADKTKDVGTALDAVMVKLKDMGDISDTASKQINQQKQAWEESKIAMGNMGIGIVTGLLPFLKGGALGIGMFVAGLNTLITKAKEVGIVIVSLYQAQNEALRMNFTGAWNILKEQDSKRKELVASTQEANVEMLANINNAFDMSLQKTMAAELGMHTKLAGQIAKTAAKQAAEQAKKDAEARKAEALRQAQMQAEATSVENLAKSELNLAKARQAAAKGTTKTSGTGPEAIKAALTEELDARRVAYADAYELLVKATEKDLLNSKLTAAAKRNIVETFNNDVKTLDIQLGIDEETIRQRGILLFLAYNKKQEAIVEQSLLNRREAEAEAAKTTLILAENALEKNTKNGITDWAKYYKELDDIRMADIELAIAEQKYAMAKSNGTDEEADTAYQEMLQKKARANDKYNDAVAKDINAIKKNWHRMNAEELAMAIKQTAAIIKEMKKRGEATKNLKDQQAKMYIQMGALIAAQLGNQMMAMAGNNKKMFETGKALALAGTIVSGIFAVMESFKNGGGYPWGLIPAGLMAATVAVEVAKINSTQFQGQAHAGINRIPREGTYLLDRGEAVIPSKFNPYAFGDKAGGGGKASNITIDARGAWFENDRAVNNLAKKLERAKARGYAA